jgi:hypothetical protein
MLQVKKTTFGINVFSVVMCAVNEYNCFKLLVENQEVII